MAWKAARNVFKARSILIRSLIVPLFAFALTLPAGAAAPPAIGERPPDFVLSTPAGKSVRLSGLMSKGPVALVVLRGFPGYQCPYCNRQVQDFIRNAPAFAAAGVQVVLIYPGPPQDLDSKANQFLADKKLPDNFDLLLDPGYKFTDMYGLRWDVPRETAYPSTFLLNRDGQVFFSKIVKEHGGRTTAAEILDALPKPKPKPSN